MVAVVCARWTVGSGAGGEDQFWQRLRRSEAAKAAEEEGEGEAAETAVSRSRNGAAPINL